MIVNVDSWLGRIANVKSKRIADECSLYRAVVMGLLVHCFFNIFLPLVAGIAILGSILLAIETGQWPGLWIIEEQVLFEFIEGVYGPYLGAAIVIPMLLGTFVMTLLPVAAVICGVGFALYLLWNYVIVTLASKAAVVGSKATEVSAVRAISTGVKNWHNGFCRPVEVFNPAIPVGLQRGARVNLLDRSGDVMTEGLVRGIRFNHRDDTATLTLDGPDLTWFNHGIDDSDRSYWDYPLNRIKVLDTPTAIEK